MEILPQPMAGVRDKQAWNLNLIIFNLAYIKEMHWWNKQMVERWTSHNDQMLRHKCDESNWKLLQCNENTFKVFRFGHLPCVPPAVSATSQPGGCNSNKWATATEPN